MLFPDTLTPEWVAKEFGEDGYGSKCGLSATKGIKLLMTNYLKANGVYYSDTDNAEKWRRVVRDVVKSEHHHAKPYHYSRTPAKFYRRWDFIVYHHCVPARLIHSPMCRLACVLMFTYWAHYWSFELYVKPFGMLPPCSKLPIQAQCHVLKAFQDYTFNGWNDFAKGFLMFVVNAAYGQVAQVIAPLRHR